MTGTVNDRTNPDYRQTNQEVIQRRKEFQRPFRILEPREPPSSTADLIRVQRIVNVPFVTEASMSPL